MIVRPEVLWVTVVRLGLDNEGGDFYEVLDKWCENWAIEGLANGSYRLDFCVWNRADPVLSLKVAVEGSDIDLGAVDLLDELAVIGLELGFEDSIALARPLWAIIDASEDCPARQFVATQDGRLSIVLGAQEGPVDVYVKACGAPAHYLRMRVAAGYQEQTLLLPRGSEVTFTIDGMPQLVSGAIAGVTLLFDADEDSHARRDDPSEEAFGIDRFGQRLDRIFFLDASVPCRIQLPIAGRIGVKAVIGRDDDGQPRVTACSDNEPLWFDTNEVGPKGAIQLNEAMWEGGLRPCDLTPVASDLGRANDVANDAEPLLEEPVPTDDPAYTQAEQELRERVESDAIRLGPLYRQMTSESLKTEYVRLMRMVFVERLDKAFCNLFDRGEYQVLGYEDSPLIAYPSCDPWELVMYRTESVPGKGREVRRAVLPRSKYQEEYVLYRGARLIEEEMALRTDEDWWK